MMMGIKRRVVVEKGSLEKRGLEKGKMMEMRRRSMWTGQRRRRRI